MPAACFCGAVVWDALVSISLSNRVSADLQAVAARTAVVGNRDINSAGDVVVPGGESEVWTHGIGTLMGQLGPGLEESDACGVCGRTPGSVF